MEFARASFTLAAPPEGQQQGQHSLESHLRQAARSLKVDEEEFIQSQLKPSDDADVETDLPEELVWHWNAFCELDRRRTAGFVPNPIGYNDIGWWAQHQGIELEPWEVDVLMALDDVWLEVWNGRHSRSQHSRQKP